MNRLYSAVMLRRLVAIFALITGLTALAAPAQAVPMPFGKTSEVAASYSKSMTSADARCEVEEGTQAPAKPKKSKGKAVKKRIIIIPPIHTGIDFAHE
ncbi:hypothetical protein [Altererythrobacter sp. MF3-039]|uniref:hypothetical protein n=1 Tax=Altererythrobacter sp. MF3-039 TaxID=3252901 RepID=UPI00390CAE97